MRARQRTNCLLHNYLRIVLEFLMKTTLANLYRLLSFTLVVLITLPTVHAACPVPSLIIPPQESATDNVAQWHDIVAGRDYVTAIDNDGGLWFWNWYDNKTDNLGFLPNQIAGENTWCAISGLSNLVAAIDNNGALWSVEMIGNDGAFINVINDKQVWQSVAASNNAIYALNVNDELWATDIKFGSVGFSGIAFSDESLPLWKQVTSTPSITMGLRKDGTLWQWSSLNMIDEIVFELEGLSQVGNESVWAQVSVGQPYSFAIKDDGTLWGWLTGTSSMQQILGNDFKHVQAHDFNHNTQLSSSKVIAYVQDNSNNLFAIMTPEAAQAQQLTVNSIALPFALYDLSLGQWGTFTSNEDYLLAVGTENNYLYGQKQNSNTGGIGLSHYFLPTSNDFIGLQIKKETSKVRLPAFTYPEWDVNQDGFDDLAYILNKKEESEIGLNFLSNELNLSDEIIQITAPSGNCVLPSGVIGNPDGKAIAVSGGCDYRLTFYNDFISNNTDVFALESGQQYTIEVLEFTIKTINYQISVEAGSAPITIVLTDTDNDVAYSFDAKSSVVESLDMLEISNYDYHISAPGYLSQAASLSKSETNISITLVEGEDDVLNLNTFEGESIDLLEGDSFVFFYTLDDYDCEQWGCEWVIEGEGSDNVSTKLILVDTQWRVEGSYTAPSVDDFTSFELGLKLCNDCGVQQQGTINVHAKAKLQVTWDVNNSWDGDNDNEHDYLLDVGVPTMEIVSAYEGYGALCETMAGLQTQSTEIDMIKGCRYLYKLTIDDRFYEVFSDFTLTDDVTSYQHNIPTHQKSIDFIVRTKSQDGDGFMELEQAPNITFSLDSDWQDQSLADSSLIALTDKVNISDDGSKLSYIDVLNNSDTVVTNYDNGVRAFRIFGDATLLHYHITNDGFEDLVGTVDVANSIYFDEGGEPYVAYKNTTEYLEMIPLPLPLEAIEQSNDASVSYYDDLGEFTYTNEINLNLEEMQGVDYQWQQVFTDEVSSPVVNFISDDLTTSNIQFTLDNIESEGQMVTLRLTSTSVYATVSRDFHFVTKKGTLARLSKPSFASLVSLQESGLVITSDDYEMISQAPVYLDLTPIGPAIANEQEFVNITEESNEIEFIEEDGLFVEAFNDFNIEACEMYHSIDINELALEQIQSLRISSDCQYEMSIYGDYIASQTIILATFEEGESRLLATSPTILTHQFEWQLSVQVYNQLGFELSEAVFTVTDLEQDYEQMVPVSSQGQVSFATVQAFIDNQFEISMILGAYVPQQVLINSENVNESLNSDYHFIKLPFLVEPSEIIVNENTAVLLSATIANLDENTQVRWLDNTGAELVTSYFEQTGTFNASIVSPKVTSIAQNYQYFVEISHNVGEFDTIVSTVTMTVNNVVKPVALSTTTTSADEGEIVNLVGTVNTESEGQLSYQWQQLNDDGLFELTNATQAESQFIAPMIDADGSYSFVLSVYDDGELCEEQTVIVELKNVNNMPSIVLDETVSTNEDTQVSVQALVTDLDQNDELSYLWTQTSGLTVELVNVSSTTLQFTAPAVEQDQNLGFQLTVNDGSDEVTSSINIVIKQINQSSVVVVNDIASVNEGTLVNLTAQVSDADINDVLTYSWVQTGGLSVGDITNANSFNASFTAPQIEQDTLLIFQFSVNDGTSTVSKILNVNVKQVNIAPTVIIPTVGNAEEGSTVTISAAANDVDVHDNLSYLWTQLDENQALSLLNKNTSDLSFVAPELSQDTVFNLQLAVSDGSETVTEQVSITLTNVNKASTVSAGTDQTVNENVNVTLTGSASDLDEDTLTYQWLQTSGQPSLTILGANSLSPQFTAPSLSFDQAFTFEIQVFDGEQTVTDSVVVNVLNVNVEPTAVVTAPTSVTEGQDVSLSVDASDLDEDELTYQWTLVSDALAVTLTNTETDKLSFVAPSVDEDSTLVFEIAVSDGSSSVLNTVSLTVLADVDSTAPIIVFEQNNIVIEATGELTSFVPTGVTVTDDVDTDLQAQLLNPGPYSLGIHTLNWQVFDSAGNEANASQILTVEDTTDPVFSNLEPVTITAIGEFTDILSLVSTPDAFDNIDDNVSVDLLSDRELVSGQHLLTWLAQDDSGNELSATQTLTILPLLSIEQSAVAAVNSTLNIEVSLSGPAATYPVTFEYTVSGSLDLNEHDLESGLVSFEQGLSDTITINIKANDIVNEQSLIINLNSVENASLSDFVTSTIKVSPRNFTPVITTSVMQNQAAVAVIDTNEGDVTIKAFVSDSNPDDSHQIAWQSLGLVNLSPSDDEFVIDPSTYEAGCYIVTAEVTENTDDALSSQVETLIAIKASVIELTDVDTDGDGISDKLEGFSDPDGDGIPAYLDTSSDSSMLPSDAAGALLQTSNDLQLRVGSVGKLLNGCVENTVGESPVDDTIEGYEAVSAVVDFAILGLDEVGGKAPIMIAMAPGTALPAGAIYRKYLPDSGWLTFIPQGENQLYSAAKNNGFCPPTISPLYKLGINEGDECVLVYLVDGGPYDADGMANAQILDPGVIMAPAVSELPEDAAEKPSKEDGNEEEQGNEEGDEPSVAEKPASSNNNGGGAFSIYLLLLLLIKLTSFTSFLGRKTQTYHRD